MKLSDYQKMLVLPWDENGFAIHPEIPAKQCFKFFREAILDSHLLVLKCIGFKPYSLASIDGSQNYPTRCPYYGESYVELANKFNHMLFLQQGPNRGNSLEYFADLPVGHLKMADIQFSQGAYTQPLKILSKDEYFCTVLSTMLGGSDTVKFAIHLMYSHGYRSITEAEGFSDKLIFPINTSFNIMEFVSVLPMYQDNRIHYKLFNGMTPDILKKLFSDYFTNFVSMENMEEEKKWVESL